MIYKFLEEYLENILENTDKKYNLTDEDKKDILEDIRYNDYIWQKLYDEMMDALEDYKIEEGDK